MTGSSEAIGGKSRVFSYLPPDMPVLGFTGALGSGCTTFSKALSKYHDYFYYSLSTPIHEEAKALGKEENSKNLQDIGNYLRKQHGLDVLVWIALAEADEAFKDKPQDFKGIVIDGIRNSGEVQCLRAMVNFFLFSIHVEENQQRDRLLQSGRYKDEAEYKAAVKRDASEGIEHGQQINLCNELSDIVVLNTDDIQVNSEKNLRHYIGEKIYDPYVNLIEIISQPDKKVVDWAPTSDHSLMTVAYVESKRSRCLKRKVGAVIATKDGDIISSGYNDVPEGSESCWEHPEYKWCRRDIQQEKAGRGYEHCPKCGEKIEIKTTCINCGQEIKVFSKRCAQCGKDPEVRYECPKCETFVFQQYLAGASVDAGKMLDICRSLHAEETAIVKLSKMGIRLPDGARMFITAFPCNLCANKIAKLGIKEVVYSEPYVTKEARSILQKKGVNLKRFEGVKSSAYFRLYK